MSSFFTLPASQRKRKRTGADGGSVSTSKAGPRSNRRREESISGSDVSDNEAPAEDVEDEGSSGDEIEDEDPAAKRLRLAERYLANTQKEVLQDEGFDAADVDLENLERRMGERLKEDTAESRGKLYRWIADDFDWAKCSPISFRHHQKAVTGIAISKGAIYTVGKDAQLVKWQIRDGKEQVTDGRPTTRKPKRVMTTTSKKIRESDQDQHESAVLCVAASQDGKFVASGDIDRKIIVWDAVTLKPLKTFQQHRDAVTGLSFRRGTNQLFSVSRDRTVKIWSLDELAYVETLFGHQDEVVDVSSLAQEKCVTVGARDRTARYWKVIEESQLVFRGGGASGRTKRADRNDNDMTSDPAIEHHEGSMDRVACIDEETFVTGSDNGTIALWNIHKKKAVHSVGLAHGMDPPPRPEDISSETHPDLTITMKPQPRWITALKAIPFSNVFVSGSWDGYIRAWRISSDKRKIEPLGRLGCSTSDVDDLLSQEGIESNALTHSALTAIREGIDGQGRIDGFINDLAITENGNRAKDGLIVLAALGRDPRLGKWRSMKSAKNSAYMFEIPRQTTDEQSLSDSAAETRSAEGGDDEFAGFD